MNNLDTLNLPAAVIPASEFVRNHLERGFSYVLVGIVAANLFHGKQYAVEVYNHRGELHRIDHAYTSQYIPAA